MEMTTSHCWQDGRLAYVCLALFGLVVLAAWATTMASPPVPAQSARQEPAAPGELVIEVTGRTQCILVRRFSIAPVPLHAVTEVLVQPGSRVKKGQRLVKLDDDEPQADVRGAQIALQEARRALGQAENYREAIPEQRYHEFRVAALKAERDERAAKAALDAAKAELEHYEVASQIDGVVSWLEVHPGMVSRPGTTVWGEILDLREVDVCCELTLEQVERIAVGQEAEIRKKGQKAVFRTGHVISVGIAVDRKSELVPVLVRLSNPDERLRCGEPVRVRFAQDLSAVRAAK
jgi:RND family efflux transporter MFP subunit